MKRSVRFRRTTVLMVGLLAFLAGLGLARLDVVLSFGWVLASAVCLTVTFSKKQVVTVLAVIAFGVALGWWRGGQFMHRLVPYHDVAYEKVVLQVTAEQDGTYVERGQLGFDGGKVRIVKPFEAEVPGRVKVQGFGEPAVFRGDIVQVEGKFFPTRGSRQGTVSFAELKVLGQNESVIDTVRRKFVAGITTALPEPQASFALGILIGQRTTLPDDVTAQLAAVGLTHIIAVSGYNLTIIVRAIRYGGKKRSKYQMTALSVILIIGFLLVTGFSASIVRAAIVSMLSLLAWYYGRTFRPVLLLALTAALTAGWSPLYIWSDIGWYLSFLAFYGVLVLAPLVTKRFYGANEPKLIAAVTIETIAAQIMTVPLILYIFQETSLVALLGNVLVVPMVPIAMLFSLVAGLAGMFLPAVSGWLAWPAYVVLTYILDVAAVLARIPHAIVERALPLAWMIMLYSCLAFVSVVLWRKTEVKRGILEQNEDTS